MPIWKKQEIADELRQSRLSRVPTAYLGNASLDDGYLYAKMLAAQRELETALRIFIEPVEVLPFGAPQAEIDALEEDGIRWAEEPGYDLGSEFWAPGAWGYTLLRHPPVIALHSAKLVYPAPADGVFDFPLDWLRLDRKRGHLRVVPTGNAAILPLAGLSGHLLAGGGTVPQMLQVRYRSGLTDIETNYPDVVNVVKQMAVLSIIQDAYVPSSGSMSIDGMSQSTSFDIGQQKEVVADRIADLRDGLLGIRTIVV